MMRSSERRGERHRSGGFSLIELLVSIGIIGVVMALTLPAMSAARSAARRAVCGTQLKQVGIATNLYLDSHKGAFFRYFTTEPGGQLWWFGYEAGGPGSGTMRPLDKSRGALAPYLSSLDARLQCPAFPYDDPGYFPKFEHRSASYGYNLELGPSNVGLPVARRSNFANREAEVFVFADGIHFDMNPVFNEGHYIAWAPSTAMQSGYAHFRHSGRAQVLMMDGHVEGVAHEAGNHKTIAGGPSGNLRGADTSRAVYGQ